MRKLCEFTGFFWEHVAVGRNDECWPWMGTLRGEYGLFQGYPAHRWAYELYTGLGVQNYGLHKCNFKICCNPHHIYDGTQKENIVQAVADELWVGKKTKKEIREAIKAAPENMRNEEVAKKYGVSLRTVSVYRKGHKQNRGYRR
jgi:hypothetical protein